MEEKQESTLTASEISRISMAVMQQGKVKQKVQ